MNEKDVREKNLLAIDEVFADFLNAFFIPDGASRISPNDLSDASPELISLINDGVAHKFRDVFKCLRNRIGINLMFLGLENQTKPDPAMPVRVMVYDALSYFGQLDASKPKKRLIPVVTFVLYFGYTERWNAPRALRGCLDVPPDFECRFVDYPIRVIELAWLSDAEIQKLTGELKFIAQTLRCFRKRDFDSAPQGLTHHACAVLTLLEKITREQVFAEMKEKYKQEENADMCEIMEEFKAHFRAQGEARGIAIGEANGIAIGEANGEARGIAIGEAAKSKSIAKNLIAMRMNSGDIAKATGLSLKEVQDLARMMP